MNKNDVFDYALEVARVRDVESQRNALFILRKAGWTCVHESMSDEETLRDLERLTSKIRRNLEYRDSCNEFEIWPDCTD